MVSPFITLLPGAGFWSITVLGLKFGRRSYLTGAIAHPANSTFALAE
jgi:hypothetical protein